MNLGKKSLTPPAYTLTGALSGMRPVEVGNDGRKGFQKCSFYRELPIATSERQGHCDVSPTKSQPRQLDKSGLCFYYPSCRTRRGTNKIQQNILVGKTSSGSDVITVCLVVFVGLLRVHIDRESVLPWSALNTFAFSQYEAVPECKGLGKPEISRKKTRRPAASSGTIPTCKNPGAIPERSEPGSSRCEASSQTSAQPRSRLASPSGVHRTIEFKYRPLTHNEQAGAGRAANRSHCEFNYGRRVGWLVGSHAAMNTGEERDNAVNLRRGSIPVAASPQRDSLLAIGERANRIQHQVNKPLATAVIGTEPLNLIMCAESVQRPETPAKVASQWETTAREFGLDFQVIVTLEAKGVYRTVTGDCMKLKPETSDYKNILKWLQKDCRTQAIILS
ncbi:hypothetical protein PR048_032438 [Dryococelus australis]|uniref:Uncharacterized protein n=1 Tax=Dryococelus australis TaxID=614101 RepID=A0ABQ9G6A8_9NEOP|nr:hypothetical protein PR048_032438 [Dryococelus australis]